jgi:hypothetical protein
MLQLDVESVDVADNDSIINFVQNERLIIYSVADAVDTKMELLNQLAKTALDNKKIKTDSEGKMMELGMAKQLHTLISTVAVGRNPFVSENLVGDVPILTLPDIEINPGETEIGLSNLSMDDIKGLSPGMQGLDK